MENKNTRNEGIIDIEGYIYRVTQKDVATQIKISKGDYLILKLYKEQKRKPFATIIHCMIGQAAKCWVEDHASKLQELDETKLELEKWRDIALIYYKKYGPLRVIRRQQQP